MGRRPWATSDQLTFLRSYIPELPKAKAGTGLNVLYVQVAQEFLTHWAAEPTTSHPTETELIALSTTYPELVAIPITPTVPLTPEQLDALAKIRLHSRVSQWYKTYLKGEKAKGKKNKNGHSQEPYPNQRPLDLTGRNARKKPPYQPHQAFSVLYWRPISSPLRREVDDLWAKREDDAIHELLGPFVKASGGIISLSRLQFHMAVMQWKCSLLSPDESATLQSWIDEQRVLSGCPWAVEAETYGNSLVAENRHIQSHIDNIPLTVQMAIEEIERYTGFKTLVLIGGLEPSKGGAITAHVYATGHSVETGLEFPQAWGEFQRTRDSYIEWLRTAYTNDEYKNRSVYTSTPETINPTSPGPTTLPGFIMSPGPATSPGLQSPDPEHSVDSQQLDPDPDRMNVDPVPTATIPPLCNGLETDLDTSTSPLPGLSPPSSPVAPQQSNSVTTRVVPTQLPLAVATKGTFDIKGIHGTFVNKTTVRYWKDIPGGEKWVAMVRGYIDLERMAPIDTPLLHLPTELRPLEVQNWSKGRKYSKKGIPVVNDVHKYREEWISWWTASQPKWRHTQSWPFPKGREGNGSWEDFPARGRHGIFLAIMATCWWARAVTSVEDFALFEEAVSDVHWVVQELVRIRSPPPTSEPQMSTSTSWMRTFSRSGGKRTITPSQRALDTLQS